MLTCQIIISQVYYVTNELDSAGDFSLSRAFRFGRGKYSRTRAVSHHEREGTNQRPHHNNSAASRHPRKYYGMSWLVICLDTRPTVRSRPLPDGLTRFLASNVSKNGTWLWELLLSGESNRVWISIFPDKMLGTKGVFGETVNVHTAHWF